jgi:hypothetical protein
MMSEEEGMEGGTGIDAIISRVDAYIKNPKMVTPETLSELKGELEDLKSYLDEDAGEDEYEGKEKPAGLTIMLGKAAGEKE